MTVNTRLLDKPYDSTHPRELLPNARTCPELAVKLRELRAQSKSLAVFAMRFIGPESYEVAAAQAGITSSHARRSVGTHTLLREVLTLRGLNLDLMDGARDRDVPIATKIERQRWWTKLMYDQATALPFRIKASELLGRSEGDFTERTIIEGGDSPIIVTARATDLEDRIRHLTGTDESPADSEDDEDYLQ